MMNCGENWCLMEFYGFTKVNFLLFLLTLVEFLFVCSNIIVLLFPFLFSHNLKLQVSFTSNFKTFTKAIKVLKVLFPT